MSTLLSSLAVWFIAFVDQRPELPPPLPEWAVVEVWCAPVPEIGAHGAWVTFVAHGGRLHGGGGSMPLLILNRVQWRNHKR
jgi:hypothetical protein